MSWRLRTTGNSRRTWRVYQEQTVVTTMSPSMDIAISSNFECFLFDVMGGDAALLRWQELVSL